MDPFDLTAECCLTQNSPFPRHVQEFLYAGKVFRPLDQTGVSLDMRTDTYRSMLGSIEDRLKKEQFSCAKISMITPSQPRKRTQKRLMTQHLCGPETKVASETITPVDLEEKSEESWDDSGEETRNPLPTPLKPSAQLIEFLKNLNPPKKKSAIRRVGRKGVSCAVSPASVSPDLSYAAFRVASPKSLLHMKSKKTSFPALSPKRETVGTKGNIHVKPVYMRKSSGALEQARIEKVRRGRKDVFLSLHEMYK